MVNYLGKFVLEQHDEIQYKVLLNNMFVLRRIVKWIHRRPFRVKIVIKLFPISALVGIIFAGLFVIIFSLIYSETAGREFDEKIRADRKALWNI